jgi:hypothetical protein
MKTDKYEWDDGYPEYLPKFKSKEADKRLGRIMFSATLVAILMLGVGLTLRYTVFADKFDPKTTQATTVRISEEATTSTKEEVIAPSAAAQEAIRKMTMEAPKENDLDPLAPSPSPSPEANPLPLPSTAKTSKMGESNEPTESPLSVKLPKVEIESPLVNTESIVPKVDIGFKSSPELPKTTIMPMDFKKYTSPPPPSKKVDTPPVNPYAATYKPSTLGTTPAPSSSGTKNNEFDGYTPPSAYTRP